MSSLKDIAKKTGYSLSTVSKALNGYDDVSENAKEVIIAVAEKMNYYPNYDEKKLHKRVNKTIALIIHGLSESNDDGNAVLGDIIKGVVTYSIEAELDMVLYHVSKNRQNEISYYKFCKTRDIDGAILLGFGMEDPYILEAKQTKYPIVLFDAILESTSQHIGAVTIDNIQMAKKATKYLIDIGCKKIAFINGRKEAQVSYLRELGYRQALDEQNILIDEELIVYADFLTKKAYNQTLQLLHTNSDIDAIFCASDMMAIGVYEATRELGIQIPNELNVIGFDGILLSKFIQPKLTTVKQDFVKMAYLSAKLLREIVYENQKGKSLVVDSEMIIRESTKPTMKGM